MTLRQALSRAAAAPFILLIRVYQVTVSPLLPPACRFTPSCSRYFLEALGKWGLLRGMGLGLRRLLRCHPFGSGGYDPVPDPPGDGPS
jgi:putative membrane protein insertion efficiency factor